MSLLLPLVGLNIFWRATLKERSPWGRGERLSSSALPQLSACSFSESERGGLQTA